MRYIIALLVFCAWLPASDTNNITTRSIEDLLGMSVNNAIIASKDFGLEFKQSKEVDKSAVVMGYGSYLSDPRCGIELVADEKSIITTIHIFTVKDGERMAYGGKIPLGILSTDGMDVVRSKFKVKPSRENLTGVRTPLGKNILWMRYDIGNIGYHFSWDAGTGIMEQVSIMSPIPSHLK